MISTHVADAQGNRDLHPSMENAIAGFLRAREQLLLSMDAVDAYQSATNALYVAFVQDNGVTDRKILCEAFGAFRKALIGSTMLAKN
jgi:hypothetical protein